MPADRRKLGGLQNILTPTLISLLASRSLTDLQTPAFVRAGVTPA